MKQQMYMIIYIFIEACQISTRLHSFVQYMNSVSADRDQSRLEQLKLLLFLIISVNILMVSVLQSIEVQHQISFNFRSLIL